MDPKELREGMQQLQNGIGVLSKYFTQAKNEAKKNINEKDARNILAKFDETGLTGNLKTVGAEMQSLNEMMKKLK